MVSEMRVNTYWLEKALLPDGWVNHVRVTTDTSGLIRSVEPASKPHGAAVLRGICIPGMPNCHSHAFQRAMAGFAEHAANPQDDFWSWRELMYRLAAQVTPEELYAIAAQLYLEMLTAGYTSVAEFHYLHDSSTADGPLAMSMAIIEAAQLAGIRLAHLPVLYQASDFGGKPPKPEQQRFVLSEERFQQLISDLDSRTRERPLQIVGLAFHSLRAVSPDAMTRTLEACSPSAKSRPIHIHIAEQPAEVEACLAWCGRRPVEFLLQTASVNENWCLVHATHMQTEEIVALARSRAVAGLCPTTEANLGDGLFPLRAFLQERGRLAIGSDSHVSISPVEELRWLEYGQRLLTGRRTLAANSTNPHVGANLFHRAIEGGASAIGQPVGKIAPGYAADWIVLDGDHPQLCGAPDDVVLDCWVFSGNQNVVRDVVVGGEHVVRAGTHVKSADIRNNFQQTMLRLRERLAS